MSGTLLELKDVVVLHRTDPTGPFGLWSAKPVRAVDGVSLSISRGETLGLMGGSGAGKTTLAEAATLRRPVDRGGVFIEGKDARQLDRKRARRRLQMVRQDARDSLEMAQTTRKQLQELMRLCDLPDGEARIAAAMERVGLPPGEFLDRTPQQMSGGQQQRLAIARALAVNPVLIALDEPVSGVDPQLQAEILRLLAEVQRKQGTAYLLISQDVRVISRLSHRVGIMHSGRLLELGPAEQVLTGPRHPFSQRFLGRTAEPLPPEEDAAGRVLQGCPWAPHCPAATERCRKERPAMREVAPGHLVACPEV
ncbi:oligopeptide/dipeptide ABC transporter ATP-binding protein [Symbiobacterium terraclitae]|uniref:Oligopeptide/dipeptide ABC transporter ATP-binding protein n=1 Tax=Symbiobacterium terraclitae TaxID=557451 RepID=A0ABS4JRD2_9FIRM|nr:ABC transporter ATP-binding protein [Symbiobacterium terraclitae]MBP2017556.1 oligopeptide/dipeptide ABC transporter ATP-binding protein [Symbiobacterium terraclitae]